MLKRNTIQRQLVIDAVRSLANHPTADEVYNAISITHPNISKGTVYRNLNSLSDEGLLKRIQIANSADRFDHHLPPHYHIECLKCGCFKDIEMPYLNELDSRIEELTGYNLISQDIVFKGVCQSCRDK